MCFIKPVIMPVFFLSKKGGGEKNMNSSTFNRKVKKILVSTIATGLVFAATALPTFADTVSPIDFESPYTIGNINGQQGWIKAGAYDAAVAAVSGFSNASGFGFGTQALRLSNAVTSGSFGDQTFSPGLSSPAGEAVSNTHFEASFDIGSTQSTQQVGLFTSVSPDDGNGGRMSYVGFEDQADGIHVIFYDVTDPGPLPTVASFNPSDVATIDRTSKHTIKFAIDFLSGPANDIVKLYVDGVLKKTGTSWEDYYRYDPEQNGNGHVIPTTSKLLFREGGTAAPGNNGNGYLVDNVTLSSTAPVPPSVPTIIVPADGAHVTSAALVKVDWTDSTGTNSPFQYQYEAYSDSGYSSLIYSSGWLSASEIPTPGTPVGDYWVRVRAKDATSTFSGWSNGSGSPYHFTVVPLVGPPTLVSQCKNNGWQTFNNPSFANQGACVSYVRAHSHSVLGNVKYTAYGLLRSAQFAADTADGGGAFQYSDANHAWYRVLITSLKVDGHSAWFAGRVWQASNPSWVGNWLFAKVNDSSPKRIWGSFTTQLAAESGVSSMGTPADGPFNTIGALVVH